MARANASTAQSNPEIKIAVPRAPERKSIGAAGGSVFCYQTIQLNVNEQVTFTFNNITTALEYNSYFIAYMNKYF